MDVFPPALFLKGEGEQRDTGRRAAFRFRRRGQSPGPVRGRSANAEPEASGFCRWKMVSYWSKMWRGDMARVSAVTSRPSWGEGLTLGPARGKRSPAARGGNSQVVRHFGSHFVFWIGSIPKFSATGVDGARWLLRTSNPLCLVTSGVGGFDSLALPPENKGADSGG